MVIIANLKGEILYINDRVESILGFSRKNIKEMTVFNIVYDEKKFHDELNIIKNYILAENVSYTHNPFETDFKTSDKKIISVKLLLSPIKEPLGNLVGVLMVAQDLTQEKKLEKEIIARGAIERELRETNIKLKELDKYKTDFLSTVSHELRTPLSSVMGFSKMIKKRLNKDIKGKISHDDVRALNAVEKISENLEIIYSEGERLTALISDVLDIAKMEAGQMVWKMQFISINDVIDRAVAAIISLVEEKKLCLVKEIEDSIPQIYADPDKLIQVVINIISNAIKFTAKGQIICKAKKEADNLLVSIADTGVGIHKEDIGQIFDKFKQVKDTITNGYGSGLGLSISKQIIEYHGGKIWAESKAGEGSIFLFTIPLTNEKNYKRN